MNGAPFARHGSIVHCSHDIACDFLPQLAAKLRISFGNARRLQRMHASFMQNHDRSRLRLAVLHGNGVHVHAAARAPVLRPDAVACGDEHALIHIEVSCRHLRDLRGIGARSLYGIAQKRDARCVVHHGVWLLRRFHAGALHQKRLRFAFLCARKRCCRCPRGSHKRRFPRVSRICIHAFAAPEHAHARAGTACILCIFYLSVHHGYVVLFRILHVQLAVVAACFKRRRKRIPNDAFLNQSVFPPSAFLGADSSAGSFIFPFRMWFWRIFASFPSSPGI